MFGRDRNYAQGGEAPTSSWALTPTLLPGGYTWSTISSSAGNNALCGVTVTSAFRCWGDNSANQVDTDAASVVRHTSPSQSVFGSATALGLQQLQSNGVSVIATGGTSGTAGTVFRSVVNSTSAADQMKLCIEIKPVGTAFTNAEADLTCSTSAVSSGAVTTVTVTGLADGTSYHWQSRVYGSESGYSIATSFGGNAESEADVVVQSDSNSQAPTSGCAQLAMNADSTCGITHEGKLFCWGRSDDGIIGDNTSDNWRFF